ncbi:LysR family transcriptional regulator [Streptomyces sp. NBC_00057]|uniref:helix-turn-helix domain-containing protein n=1 Tax=Streptomyces sp. NBC_00057 TaxID=2975634 RepID=UPI003249EDF1
MAKSGGLAPAARVLGHTRSAVSQQLAILEREVGLPLVDRSGTRMELTAAGRLLAATPVAIGATSWALAGSRSGRCGCLPECTACGSCGWASWTSWSSPTAGTPRCRCHPRCGRRC